MTDEVFERAISPPDAPIAANDRIHVATCLVNDIETIVSADKGFDAVKQLRRVDPLEPRQPTRLHSRPPASSSTRQAVSLN